MNRSRLTRLEEKMTPIPPRHYLDPTTGWHVIGGGKGSVGVLYAPPILSKEEWLAAGNKIAEASEDQF
ncbi:MAG: hypothetical protein CVU69_05080 [Deltaproteobacteria bacterium HGW-Deltaproteobacteria-4]|nr:MAG: hypothetical protein CVU69_05080 [Deltaproteobacteria bacterium HGW-Deltaproteobacteria-4]